MSDNPTQRTQSEPMNAPQPAPAVADSPATPTAARTAPPPKRRTTAAAGPPDRSKPDTPPLVKTGAIHYAILALIVLVALWVRLAEAFRSPIIGAEDPYLHMERTYNFVQGKPLDYPAGMMMLLTPFTWFGADAFYNAARFLPAFLGTIGVVGMFFLCRRYLHPAGALTSALLFATMREPIIRSNLLFPTAFDLAILPWFFLAILRQGEGRRWATYVAVGLGVVMAFSHPWVLGLLAFPIGLYFIFHAVRARSTQKWAAPAAVLGCVAAIALLSVIPGFSPGRLLTDHAVPNAAQVAADPNRVMNLPQLVNPAYMLGWAAMLLAGAGIILGFVRRSRFTLLALLWTLLLTPLMLVDWFDIWYLPHRVVGYLAIGVAMLGGLAVSELIAFIREAKPQAVMQTSVGALAVLGLFTVPSAMSTPEWYRLYNENDHAAYEEIGAMEPGYIITGSWEARAGYRALTGNWAVYNPDFFTDENVRNIELKNYPELMVLIDRRTAEQNLPTDFLQSWTLEGEWDDIKLYSPAY